MSLNSHLRDQLCINTNAEDQNINIDAEIPHPDMPLLHPLSHKHAKSSLLLFEELRSFRISLKWCALDHSSCLGRFISYSAFILLTIVVPILSCLSITLPPDVDVDDPISFNKLVQIPESALAFIAFLTLFRFFRSYTLRQLLLLDEIQEDSLFVKRGYSQELDKAFRCLAAMLFPCLVVEFAHKIIFFSAVKIEIPFVGGSSAPLNSVFFVGVLASWVYRTVVFLLLCVLFRLTCALQILRLEALQKLFDLEGSSYCKPEVIFREHIRIKEQLSLTSHRYRFFIIASLVTITVSQLGAMLLVLAFKADKTFFNSGDLLICSAVQLSGFLLCLVGAARITHRAQGIAGIASKWNMMVTSAMSSGQGKALSAPCDSSSSQDSDSSESDNLTSVPSYSQDPSPFQTRQALVAYLQHNNGGITLFGFALDRGLLHTLFAFEFSLVLWILSKVVVFS